MHYITTRGFEGRLGNQLFKILAMYSECLNSNRKLIIPHNWMYKDKFNIPNECYGNVTIFSDYLIYNDDHINDHIPTNCNLCFDGFFISFNQIKKHRSEIIDLLCPNLESDDSIGIHIRRGDYLWCEAWHIPPLSYYQNILSKYPDKKVKVFSDDITWCKNNFPSHYEFQSGNEITDLINLIRCKMIVAASSTFSILAAFLSGHDNVYMPKTYINNRTSFEDAGLIMDNWTYINEY